ncbi:MAG: zinc ABC transporter permease subunit ZnuB [Magnetococcales bacterium]|nr:zinc ABC transporter permease subunit ZnuB [Magnetococcales bacterium]
MTDPFLFSAWLAGIGVALVAGPLGCFIIWRRMAYFGDTMAHSALLGVALAFLMEWNITAAVAGVTVTLAILLVLLQNQNWISVDTLLGILSHSALSIGLVTIGLMTWLRVDLMGFLFGDVLAVEPTDLVWIYGGGFLVLAILVVIWRPLLAITVHEDMARAEGVSALPVRMAFMVLIALVIAVAMKIVGMLLITALLIIPAATARRLTRSPESMAFAAALLGVVGVTAGLYASVIWDTPSGPSMVVAAMSLFILVMSLSSIVAFYRKEKQR